MNEQWILYLTTNLVNSKIYVGVHKLATTKSKNYLGSGLALRPAIKKYGRENFTRITLAEFSCAEDAYLAEEAMVTKDFLKREDTYNMCLGGRGGIGNKGCARTPETRAKISIGNKGNTKWLGKLHSAESKKKMSVASKGRVFSTEHKNKLSIVNKGRVLSEETKNKITEASARSKPVIIHTKHYSSSTQFAKLEKIPLATVTSRIRNLKPKWSEWRYATDSEKAAHSLEVSRQSP